MCLFAVTGALADTGLPWTIVSWLQDRHLLPNNLLVLTPFVLLTSNTIGNTPTAILLLQIWPNPPQGPLYAFAVLSSLAANLTLLGSFASLIAAERAEALGVRITFAEYARAGRAVHADLARLCGDVAGFDRLAAAAPGRGGRQLSLPTTARAYEARARSAD